MAVDDSYTKSLLHFDGTNGSTTFTDESGKTWSVGASTAQLTTANKRFGTASLSLDSTGYIKTDDHDDWRLDDGSNSNLWTVDFWVNLNAYDPAEIYGLMQQRVDDNNFWGIFMYEGQLEFWVRSSSTNIIDVYDYAWNVQSGQWNHVAVVKNGTSGYTLFWNGQVVITETDTDVIPNFSAELRIGLCDIAAGTYYADALFDEVRISKGVARWTSQFIPRNAPYATDAKVFDSYTKSLLHFEDISTNVFDEIGHVWLLSDISAGEIVTDQKKFGNSSLRLYGEDFEALDEWIDTYDRPEWQLGSGSNSTEWTLECWVRFASDPDEQYNIGLISQYVDSSNYWVWYMSETDLGFYVESAGVGLVDVVVTWTGNADQWYHFALVKQGTTGYKFFVDGEQVGTTQTDTSIIPNFTEGWLVIGGDPHNYYLYGWMDEVRISNGIARWTSNFDEPTEAYNPIVTHEGAVSLSGTSVLTIVGTVAHLMHEGAISLSGTSALTIIGTLVHPIHEGAISLSGDSELICAGTVISVPTAREGEVSLNGTSALTATAFFVSLSADITLDDLTSTATIYSNPAQIEINDLEIDLEYGEILLQLLEEVFDMDSCAPEFDYYIAPDGEEYNLNNGNTRWLLGLNGTGTPPISYKIQAGPFQHGATIINYLLEPRTVTLAIREQASSRQGYWNARTNLLNILRPSILSGGGVGTGVLRKILPNGSMRDLDVVIQKGPEFLATDPAVWDAYAFVETLEFTAFNPIFYDPVEKTVYFNFDAITQLVFPIAFPITFGLTATTSSYAITYDGSWECYPKIVFYGPIENPTITHSGTGEMIRCIHIVPEGVTLTIDLSSDPKMVYDSLGNTLTSTVTSDSDFSTFRMLPSPEMTSGINTLIASGTGIKGGTTEARVIYKEKYFGI